MRKKILLFSLVAMANFAFAQHKMAYQIFKANGAKASYGKMLKAAAQADIVLFGEYHNNPIAHWLQLELTRDLGQTRHLILGAEMFERDDQETLDKYLQGAISAKALDSQARLWRNYATDYAPLVNYAKDKRIPFIATNVPRRYASMVSRAGFVVLDTLPALQKEWMAPLPILYDSTLPGYKNMLTMMAGHGANDNLPKAQALKDATMAHAILQHHKSGSLFIHYNGAYHSDNFEGIVWYLRQHAPHLKIVTISTVSQEALRQLKQENRDKANFIIAVDSDMTTTY